jgi:hypothetical protein
MNSIKQEVNNQHSVCDVNNNILLCGMLEKEDRVEYSQNDYSRNASRRLIKVDRSSFIEQANRNTEGGTLRSSFLSVDQEHR